MLDVGDLAERMTRDHFRGLLPEISRRHVFNSIGQPLLFQHDLGLGRVRRAERPPRVIAFGCVENNHPPASWKVCDIIQRSIARSEAGSAARPIFFWFVSVCPVWLRSG